MIPSIKNSWFCKHYTPNWVINCNNFHLFQFNMSPSSSSMPGYPYGSSGSYAGAMYAAATSTTKEPASLMGDSINSLRLKAKQHSSSSSPTHSELKFKKKSIFKSTKSTFLTLSKVQKHILCYFKNGKKSIFAPKKSLKL